MNQKEILIKYTGHKQNNIMLIKEKTPEQAQVCLKL